MVDTQFYPSSNLGSLKIVHSISIVTNIRREIPRARHWYPFARHHLVQEQRAAQTLRQILHQEGRRRLLSVRQGFEGGRRRTVQVRRQE